MKLITLLTLVTTCSAIEHGLQQFNQPQHPFPLQFQAPQAGSFVTENNNVYLPPDMHTAAVPYFAHKNSNDLQYQYLPPTGSKVPAKYPPPFPMFSTTFRPNNDEDDEEGDEDGDREAFGSSTIPQFDQRFNQSKNSPEPQVEVPYRPIPKTIPYYSPVDRIDTKYPAESGMNNPINTNTPPFNYQMNMNRRTIQPAGFVGSPIQNDHIMSDQMKTGSHPSHHYLPSPQSYASTSTEPVPILRLSNEMDLDGSYSYEALSGDQTHMTQHGHVENLGTDHAENVVEGSYSYVGDNGQTYTVHYIADGNGFRASGDHLPVAPPIPEIIQRSIEYNMAEESSKPHQTQNNYRNEDKLNNNGINHHYHPTLPPPPPPPSRNLFTGRQPEAFSYNHSGATSSQSNNLQPAASTQTPVISHYEAPKEQTSRMVSAPISPQVTFLASQGAHDPSESIKRMYSPPHDEESVFRFGNMRNKIEQPKPDYQKNSWQYPFLHNSVTKMTPTKNFISRSSLEQNDDVMINFSEMTPEQYSRIYHSQIKPKDESFHVVDREIMNDSQENNKVQPNVKVRNNGNYIKLREFPLTFQQNQEPVDQHSYQSIHFPYPQNWQDNINQNAGQSDTYVSGLQSRTMSPPDEQRSTLITKDYFIPPSQTITSSYDTYKSKVQSARQVKFDTNETSQFQHDHNPLTTPKNYGDDSNYNIYNTTHYTIYKSTAPTKEVIKSKLNENYESTPFLSTKKPNIQKIHSSSKSFIENMVKPEPSYKNHESELIEENESFAFPSTTHSYIQEIHPVSNSFAENVVRPKPSYENHKSYSTFYDPESEAVQEPKEENFKDILKSNIFLKNIIEKANNTEYNMNNTFPKNDENWRPSSIQIQTKNNEEKIDKKEIKKYHPKTRTANDFDDIQRKSMDTSQIANLVTLKNYFESNKIKPRQKQGSNSGTIAFGHESQSMRNKLQDIHEQKTPAHITIENNSYRIKKPADFINSNTYPSSKSENFDRMLGVAKIYKTLQRNSNLNDNRSSQIRSELMPPIQDYNALSLHRAQSGLPPLGRAGPNMKSYLPPIYS